MIDFVAHLELWLPALLCIAMSLALALRGEGRTRSRPRGRRKAGDRLPLQPTSRSSATTSAHAAGSEANGATRLTRSAKRP